MQAHDVRACVRVRPHLLADAEASVTPSEADAVDGGVGGQVVPNL